MNNNLDNENPDAQIPSASAREKVDLGKPMWTVKDEKYVTWLIGDVEKAGVPWYDVLGGVEQSVNSLKYHYENDDIRAFAGFIPGKHFRIGVKTEIPKCTYVFGSGGRNCGYELVQKSGVKNVPYFEDVETVLPLPLFDINISRPESLELLKRNLVSYSKCEQVEELREKGEVVWVFYNEGGNVFDFSYDIVFGLNYLMEKYPKGSSKGEGGIFDLLCFEFRVWPVIWDAKPRFIQSELDDGFNRFYLENCAGFSVTATNHDDKEVEVMKFLREQHTPEMKASERYRPMNFHSVADTGTSFPVMGQLVARKKSLKFSSMKVVTLPLFERFLRTQGMEKAEEVIESEKVEEEEELGDKKVESEGEKKHDEVPIMKRLFAMKYNFTKCKVAMNGATLRHGREYIYFRILPEPCSLEVEDAKFAPYVCLGMWGLLDDVLLVIIGKHSTSEVNKSKQFILSKAEVLEKLNGDGNGRGLQELLRLLTVNAALKVENPVYDLTTVEKCHRRFVVPEGFSIFLQNEETSVICEKLSGGKTDERHIFDTGAGDITIPWYSTSRIDGSIISHVIMHKDLPKTTTVQHFKEINVKIRKRKEPPKSPIPSPPQNGLVGITFFNEVVTLVIGSYLKSEQDDYETSSTTMLFFANVPELLHEMLPLQDYQDIGDETEGEESPETSVYDDFRNGNGGEGEVESPTESSEINGSDGSYDGDGCLDEDEVSEDPDISVCHKCLAGKKCVVM